MTQKTNNIRKKSLYNQNDEIKSGIQSNTITIQGLQLRYTMTHDYYDDNSNLKKKKTPTETKTSNTYNNNKAFQYFQRIHNP